MKLEKFTEKRLGNQRSDEISKRCNGHVAEKWKTAFQAVMANGRLACLPYDRPEARLP